MIGIDKLRIFNIYSNHPLYMKNMIFNKHFETVKKTTVDYVENRISSLVFKQTFRDLDNAEVYDDLEKDGYGYIGNYISAVLEIDDQDTLESQWIVGIINLFYCFFIDDYESECAKYFYKFLRIGLSQENKNPVKLSFKSAIQDYLDKKISDYCLAYIASEFLNKLNFFKKEIDKDEELFNILNITLELKPKKLLKDLTQTEIKKKEDIDRRLMEYFQK